MPSEPSQVTVNILLDDVTVPVRVKATEEELREIPRDLNKAWKQADDAGRTAQSETERGVAIGDQVRCALLKCSLATVVDKWFPASVAAMVQQRRWTTELALTWIDQMVERRRRVDSLLALAPLVADSEFPRLLAALRSTRTFRSAMFLPKELLQEGRFAAGYSVQAGLEALMEDDSVPDALYIGSLARLVQFLPESLRVEAIEEVLDVALSAAVFRSRNELLDEVVNYLPEVELQRVIDLARKLPQRRAPNHDNPRAEALLALLPRWAKVGHVDEALRMVSSLSSRWAETVLCLARIAADLPAQRRLGLFRQAREMASNLEHEWTRARVLLEIAILFAKQDHFDEALVTIASVGSEDLQMSLQAQLMEYLPPKLRKQFLDGLMSRSEVIEKMTVTEKHPTLQCTTLELVRQGDMEIALAYVEKVILASHESWKQADLLIPIISLFAELGYGEELLTHAPSLGSEWERPHLFALLAYYLPPPLNEKALQTVLSMYGRSVIGDDIFQAETMVSLLPMLPPDERPELAKTVLALGRDVDPADLEGFSKWLDILERLAKFLPQLPEPLQDAIVEKAITAARKYGDEVIAVWFLVQILPFIPRRRHQQMVNVARSVAETIDYDDHVRAEALDMLAPVLTSPGYPGLPVQVGEKVDEARAEFPSLSDAEITLDDEAVRAALSAARTINSGYGYRAEALQKIVPALLTFPLTERYSLWEETLRDLSTQRLRLDLLTDIQVLGPVIESLGGTTAVRACSQAIGDVCRWIP